MKRARHLLGWSVGLLILTICACAPKTVVRTRKGAALGRLQRVVVMPFTDDPLMPGSGLKAACYFTKAAQIRVKTIEWIGPEDVLKKQGVDIGHTLDEDSVLDAPVAMEPVLGRVLASTETIQALSPAREGEIAKSHGADALVRGSVLLDPGTGMLESMVTEKRAAQVALALQLADAVNGDVLLAFRQKPTKSSSHPTVNEFLREAADSAAERIKRSWR